MGWFHEPLFSESTNSFDKKNCFVFLGGRIFDCTNQNSYTKECHIIKSKVRIKALVTSSWDQNGSKLH